MSSENTKTERDQTIKLDVSAKIYPTKDPKQEKGSVLAFASADIGGCFAVTGIKIVEGKEGPFVAMPSQFGKDKQIRPEMRSCCWIWTRGAGRPCSV